MNPLLCDSPERARENRERIAQGYCNEYYDYQNHAARHWNWGTKQPKGLRVQDEFYSIRLHLGNKRGAD